MAFGMGSSEIRDLILCGILFLVVLGWFGFQFSSDRISEITTAEEISNGASIASYREEYLQISYTTDDKTEVILDEEYVKVQVDREGELYTQRNYIGADNKNIIID